MSNYPDRWNRRRASAPARPCPRQWGQPLPRFPCRRLRSVCDVRDVGAENRDDRSPIEHATVNLLLSSDYVPLSEKRKSDGDLTRSMEQPAC